LIAFSLHWPSYFRGEETERKREKEKERESESEREREGGEGGREGGGIATVKTGINLT